MTVVTLLKGDDIKVLLNGNVIDAVLEVKINKTEEFYDVLQYLTNEPVDKVLKKRKYEITLKKAYSQEKLFDLNTKFDLQIVSKSKTVTYIDCEIIEEEHSLLPAKDMITAYKIKCNSAEQEA